MGHPGHDQIFEIGEDLAKRFAVFRRRLGQAVEHLARRHLGTHRSRLHGRQIIGHPIDHLVRVGTEIFWCHRMLSFVAAPPSYTKERIRDGERKICDVVKSDERPRCRPGALLARRLSGVE